MSISTKILWSILALVIVLLLGALLGWYIYVRQTTAANSAEDAARGLQTAVPSFGGSLGSNAQNQSNFSVLPNAPHAQGSAQRLWEADASPVAGMGFALHNNTASSSTLYFAERANGYIFAADTGAQTTARITNTLMPRTYQALFAPGVSGVIERSLDQNGTIATFAGTFGSTTAATSSGALAGGDLASGIRSLSLDPQSGALFYVTPQQNAYGSLGMSASFSGGKPAQLFASSLESWRPYLAGGQMYLAQTAADGVPGYAYAVSKTGAMSEVVGPIDGLTILPDPSEAAMLYSASGSGGLTLYARVGNSPAIALPVRTVADKCVWLPGKSLLAYCAVPADSSDPQFLDDWYQGALHTADSFWQIDASAGTAQQIYTPTQSLDVHDPAIDPSGTYIAFLNGSDQSLWVLRIVQ